MEAGELKGKQCALTLKMPVCLVSADKKKKQKPISMLTWLFLENLFHRATISERQ